MNLLHRLGVAFSSALKLSDCHDLFRQHLVKLEKQLKLPCEANPPHYEYDPAWPRLVPAHVKKQLVLNYCTMTSSTALREYACVVCGKGKTHVDMHMGHSFVPISDYNTSILRASFPASYENSLPPGLAGTMLDADGIKLSDDNSLLFQICKDCHRELSHKKLLSRSLANDLFLGNIPPELDLKEDTQEGETDVSSIQPSNHGPSIPGTQHGMWGHVIVFPAKPEKLTRFLPPPMVEVVAPMCVIFVRSQPPSCEWLLEHAKPLVVRPAKIRAVLVKLIEINPLYSNVQLNEDMLQSLDPVGLAPVQIDVHTPSTAEEAQGSRYDDCDTLDIPIEPSGEDSEEFETLMENVGIANLDMNHVSSNVMKAAALKHLKDGGGYLAVQHGSQPVSEYDDKNLFPLLYPMLFPYGTGGFSKCQKMKLSFEALGQHYLGLFDKHFQEHYSFMFVFFNMIQRHVASQQTNL